MPSWLFRFLHSCYTMPIYQGKNGAFGMTNAAMKVPEAFSLLPRIPQFGGARGVGDMCRNSQRRALDAHVCASYIMAGVFRAG
jgi:hypothetical protein